MSISFDKKRTERIATNTGWDDLASWAEKLPVREFPNLSHLVYYGYSREIPRIADQAVNALRKFPPGNATIDMTVRHLIRLLRSNLGAEVAIVSNGITPPPSRANPVPSKNPPIRR